MISFLRRSHPPTLVTLLLLLLLFTLYLPLFDLSSQKVEIAMEIDRRQLFFRKSIIERLAGNARQFICLFRSQKVLGWVCACSVAILHTFRCCTTLGQYAGEKRSQKMLVAPEKRFSGATSVEVNRSFDNRKEGTE